MPEAEPKRATSVHEVAFVAGCSTATVSRALNGGAVSAKSRARVLAAVDALGYVPNLAARSIRGTPTMTVGLIMNFDVHPSTEVLTVINSTVRAMERQGYTCLVSLPDGSDDVDVRVRRLAERRVDGLFFWNACRAESLRLFRSAGIPVLAVGDRQGGCQGLPLITVDSATTFTRIFQRLAELGHRRIAEMSSLRSPGVRLHERQAAECGLEWSTFVVDFDTFDPWALLAELRSRDAPPTAVIAAPPVALELLEVCSDAGVTIPDDLSLIAASEPTAARLLRTPLSAITTDFVRLGEAAAAAMLVAIHGGEVADVMIDGAVGWVERASVGAAPVVP